jgi:hypothetical protein
VFRRVPIVRAEIALHSPRRAAVLLHPPAGRWPEHEAADRLAVGVAMCALAAQGTPEPRWLALREILVDLASRLAAAGSGPLPGDLAPLDRLGVPGPLAVEGWEGPGRARLCADVLDTRGGLVPRLSEEEGASGPARQIAALALIVALAADADADGRLALALAVEGLISWYRESDRLTAPRHALVFALAHAAGRLRESGRPVPAGI